MKFSFIKLVLIFMISSLCATQRDENELLESGLLRTNKEERILWSFKKDCEEGTEKVWFWCSEKCREEEERKYAWCFCKEGFIMDYRRKKCKKVIKFNP